MTQEEHTTVQKPDASPAETTIDVSALDLFSGVVHWDSPGTVDKQSESAREAFATLFDGIPQPDTPTLDDVRTYMSTTPSQAPQEKARGIARILQAAKVIGKSLLT